MKNYYKWSVSIIALVWLTLSSMAWIKPAEDISVSERRKLKQFPIFSLDEVLNAKFMNSFESYAQDQFPNRFFFRTIKAYTRFYGFKQKDNNNIYIEDGYAAKIEYPLNESSIYNAATKFEELYHQYLSESEGNIYLSIIPDKGYFMAGDKGYPSMDYEKLFYIIKENTPFATYIDITSKLSVEDYYKTDIHWRQENLGDLANHINTSMNNESLTEGYELVQVVRPFYGVYYGHSALPLNPEQMNYLTNDIIKNSSVFHVENEMTLPIYDLEKMESMDLYDIFLSGSSPILHITNPNSKTNKELVIFRDSFGSSIAPLLLENYSKITMIDIRYIASEYLGEYIDFNGQDILFLYSTVVLNSSNMLR